MKINPSAFQMSRHLADDSLMPPDSECRFCGSSNRVPVYELQEDPKVTLLKCADCGAATASRIPTDQALNDYYSDYYKIPVFAKNHDRVTCDGTHRFGRYLGAMLAEYIDDSTQSSIRMLDFGGGDGSIAVETARHLLDNGFSNVEITIVDFNKTLIATTDSRISVSRHDLLEQVPQGSFDVVLASGVIEHLPHPKKALVDLLDLLGKGGLFYARTPFVVPFAKVTKLFGIKWDFLFPAHIHDLGQDFWESCFSTIFPTTDFELLKSNPSIVETSFQEHFLKTLAAYAFKMPWYVFGRRHSLVGGWEVLVRKK